MVENKALQDVVLTALCKEAQKDPSFRMMSDGEEEMGKSIIEGMSQVQVDTDYKIRMMFGFLLGYGYDFTKPGEGESPRKMYENAVKNTKELGGRPHFETLVDAGVIDDKFGWYITKL